MRRILLVLDESVTDTECGTCRSYLFGGGKHGATCETFGDYIDDYEGPKRLPECLAAEKAAERCVEIDPDEAASILYLIPRDDTENDLGHPQTSPAQRDRAQRVWDALNTHAAKARKGGE